MDLLSIHEPPHQLWEHLTTGSVSRLCKAAACVLYCVLGTKSLGACVHSFTEETGSPLPSIGQFSVLTLPAV